MRAAAHLSGASGVYGANLSAAAGPSLPDVSTTVTLSRRDDRGREILDRLEPSAIPPFRWSDWTGARSYWINAQGTPADGYEAALDRLAPDWRDHLSRTPD